MEFRQQVADFVKVVRNHRMARVKIGLGSYEGPRSSEQKELSLPYSCWQLVYCYVSFTSADYTPDLLDDTDDQPHMTEATEKYAAQAFKAFDPLSEEIQGMDEEMVKAFIHKKNITRQVPQWKW
ncbi:hypothetical protein R1flu_011372 [Riccia fluitans]|uniref:Uncharacterized protein n=1 Tax=Riccia fluitans TaxID=41844 RepID=A0ABD1Z7L5_9MARC